MAETSHARSNHNKISLCEKIFSIISCAPHHHHDAEASNPSPSGWVPIVFDDHDCRAMLRKPSFEVPRKRVVMQAETQGGEKPNPNPIRTRVFSEYIERAGTVIRAGSSVGATKPAMRRDSFNTRASNYISRAKNKFMTKPSFVE